MTRKNALLYILAALTLAVSGLSIPYLLRGRIAAPVRSRIDQLARAFAKDIDLARQRNATLESAQFVDEQMPTAPAFPDRSALFRASLAAVDPKINGLYCEFGVAEGESINFIASLVDKEVHGFDSFEGLPEDWRGDYPKATFKLAAPPKVRANVKLHKGWFNETLPPFKKQFRQPLAFMHLDADLYSSTKSVFDILGDRIVEGTVIQFDEFFNYPGWKSGEYRAFKEFCDAGGVEVRYIGYCPRDEQVAVKVVRR